MSLRKGEPGHGRFEDNVDTNVEQAPESEVGCVMCNVTGFVYALRQEVGPFVPHIGAQMDVKDAVRRIHIEWEKLRCSRTWLTGFVVIDFGMPFNSGKSPGWWALTASAVLHPHRHTQ